MSKKLKNYSVVPNADKVAWEVDITEAERDAAVDVDNQCLAYYIVNSEIITFRPGERNLICSKDELKRECRLRLIGVNYNKTYDIPYGIGGVPFHDDDVNADALVGANGVCKLRVHQAMTLINALGKSDITRDDVKAYIRGQLNQALTSTLASVLNSYTYRTVMTTLPDISARMKEQLKDSFAKAGLLIEGFIINSIYFPPEFVEKRSGYFADENEMKKAAADARNKATVLRASHSDESKFCSDCGAKLERSAKFCSNCGKQQ